MSEDIAISPNLAQGAVQYKAKRELDLEELEFNPSNNLTTEVILKTLDEKIALVFHYMDDDHFQEASLATLMKALTILVDKRQLLRGEPTTIVSTEDRRSLTKLMPLMIQEAERRGMAIPIIEGEIVDA